MEIINIRTMRGPNYWSAVHHKLIVMKVDIREFGNWTSSQIRSLEEKVNSVFVQSVNYFNLVQNSRLLEEPKLENNIPHLVLNVAVKLTQLAGFVPSYKEAKPTRELNQYLIIYAYDNEDIGKEIAQYTLEMISNIQKGLSFDLENSIEELKGMARRRSFGPSTCSIINEAIKRDIPFSRLDDHSLIMLGMGSNQKLIKATITDNTSSIGVDLAGDKESTKRTLAQAYIPVPFGELIENEEELEATIDNIGYPIAIKPLNGNHGRGITTNITTIDKALDAFKVAKEISDEVIIEKYIKGNDYRFLVINYKLIAVAKRTPARVLGDGKSTIQELIDNINKDPERGKGHENNLTLIEVDEITKNILDEKGLTLETVLPQGELLILKTTANISTGGTARDVTDVVHPINVFLAERVARLMRLDICGIDIISENISVPITQNNGAVLEVNAAPGFRMHLKPTKGLPRNVAEAVIDSLFPDGDNARIPIVAITGTNGKTTTTRLISHIASSAGKSVGFTTTDGIYINGQQVYSGDCSGPSSAAAILRDPIVNFAVLESARGGILRSGLGFDKCNVSVITNVTEDHLGLGDIHTIEELADVKAVVAKSTVRDGYTILNADDDLVYAMRNQVICNVALFSMDPASLRLQQHCAQGGLAATVENGHFVICKGDWKIRVMKVNEAPLSFMGTSSSMMKNLLASILAAYVSHFKIKQISDALKVFRSTPETTPGRMNLFEFNDVKIMVDYAHNAGGYEELNNYLEHINASTKIGIVAATGDRRPEDIRNVGAYAAQMFDKIIIRHDKDTRGKTPEELTNLIMEGVRSKNPNADVKVISDEFEAIEYAKNYADKDAFIVLCADKVDKTLQYVSEMHEKEKQQAFSLSEK